MVDRLTYKGIKRSGIAAGGVVHGTSAASLTEFLYNQGWRKASVNNAASGVLVGEVTKHPDTGRRTWWAEN